MCKIKILGFPFSFFLNVNIFYLYSNESPLNKNDLFISHYNYNNANF